MMGGSDLSPAPERIQLVSAAGAGALLGVTGVQGAELGKAGVLGTEFVTDSGSGATARAFYERERIVELAAREHLSKDRVRAIAARHGYSKIVVIRQIASRPVEDPVQDRRAWYGMDYRAATSEDPELVAAQEEATRRWWAVSVSHVEYFSSLRQRGDRALLIGTVGGFVCLCRDIVGIEARERDSRTLFAYEVTAPGAWLDEVQGRWVDSGRGRAMLTWDAGPIPAGS